MLTAIGITLIIFLILISAFITAQNNFLQQENINTTITQVKKLRFILTNEIHQAGNQLCGSAPIKILGSEKQLTIYYANSGAAPVVKILDKSHLKIANQLHYEKGTSGLISDCQHTEEFIIERSKANIISLAAPLKHTYKVGAYISNVSDESFFLENSQLYVQEKNKNKIALMNNINSLQISYDVLIDENLYSLPANAIEHWENVAGVQFKITLKHSHIPWFIYAALQI